METEKELGKIERKLEIYEDFYKIIKGKVRNSGRTNVMMISELDEEIVKTGNKIFEEEDGK